jgi:hypothetical protein
MREANRPDQGMLDAVGGRTPSRERARARRRWLLWGVRDEPAPAFRGLYEDADDADRLGVCCSGGGIRSAAFNLGALQELQSCQELQKARYLSAVSGGSYIASAFCMVAKTWNDEPNDEDSDPSLFDGVGDLPFAPGTPEEQYLRNHLGYLAPDTSAKVYLGLRMVAGLLVNVLLIGLPVLIAGLVIGLALNGAYDDVGDGNVSIPPEILVPILVVLGLALAVALLDIVWRPRKDLWQTATQTWQVRLFLLAALGALVLIGVPALAAVAAGASGGSAGSDAAGGAIKSAWTALTSMAALAAAAVTHVRGTVRDRQKEFAAVGSRLGKYAKKAREILIAVVVMLAGPLLLVAIASLGVLVSVNSDDKGAVWLVATVALLGVMWIVVDLTTVSLHPFYRRRLASAFALRRVALAGAPAAQERPFDRLVALSETDVGAAWPTLIVCAAANVSDPGATPPGRAVASFTFSPTAIGGPLTGAAGTADYENLIRTRRRDVTLPAAVAMSGAAVSPSMGKLTYRPLTFLLALANIRLGVWVLNPTHVNESHGLLAGRSPSVRHRPRPQYLWKELFGRNRLGDKFLYVTDGGHYENLGLVELLRRGCRRVYCFDAGGGKTSKALGDAIALARTELNVDIDMGPEAEQLVEDEKTGRSAVVCATGTIRYPPSTGGVRPEGTLVYVRSVVSDTSPWDLREYQVVDGIFPHHSTFDQFFTDQKFEAYRRLGMCAAQAAVELASQPLPPGAHVTQLAPIEPPV